VSEDFNDFMRHGEIRACIRVAERGNEGRTKDRESVRNGREKETGTVKKVNFRFHGVPRKPSESRK